MKLLFAIVKIFYYALKKNFINDKLLIANDNFL